MPPIAASVSTYPVSQAMGIFVFKRVANHYNRGDGGKISSNLIDRGLWE